MNCVYYAYRDYLHYLGERPHPYEFALWKALKLITHGPRPQSTYAGVAPWMLNVLAGTHGYHVLGY